MVNREPVIRFLLRGPGAASPPIVRATVPAPAGTGGGCRARSAPARATPVPVPAPSRP